MLNLPIRLNGCPRDKLSEEIHRSQTVWGFRLWRTVLCESNGFVMLSTCRRGTRLRLLIYVGSEERSALGGVDGVMHERPYNLRTERVGYRLRHRPSTLCLHGLNVSKGGGLPFPRVIGLCIMGFEVSCYQDDKQVRAHTYIPRTSRRNTIFYSVPEGSNARNIPLHRLSPPLLIRRFHGGGKRLTIRVVVSYRSPLSRPFSLLRRCVDVNPLGAARRVPLITP